jgi:hypothetical protein
MESHSTCCQRRSSSRKSKKISFPLKYKFVLKCFNENRFLNFTQKIFYRISADFLNQQQITLKFPNDNRIDVFPESYPLNSSSRRGNGLKVILSRNKKLSRYDICTGLSFIIHSPYELVSSYDSSEHC